MEHLVTARNLINELVAEGQLEVRRAEIVGRDLAQLVSELQRPPSGHELEEWLEQHRMVSEVYVSAVALDQLVLRHFAAVLAAQAVLNEARHPELERQIREAPDVVEPYLVYSDWLQERGDPLGELIALGVAARDGGAREVERFERYLKRHEAHFLGGIAKHTPERVRLQWRLGLVRAIEVSGKLDANTWAQLLRLRVCELLDSIQTDQAWSEEIAAAISASAGSTLRSLTLAGCTGAPLPSTLLRRELRQLVLLGDRVSFGAETLPATLEGLELRVQRVSRLDDAHQEPLRWPVRELHVSLTADTAALLIGGLQLPRLEHLSLDVGSSPPAKLLELLGAIELPSLNQLAILNGRLDQQALRRLVQLPVIRGLVSLGLTSLEITDEGMAVLAAQRRWLSSLAVLDLSNNELSRDGLAVARTLAPEVISRRQERPGSGAHRRLRRFAGSRLQVAEEIADPKWWRDAGIDGDLLWARYRGGADYELFVSRDLSRHGCSCPSSIQPCKHVVALALVAERRGLAEGPSGGIEGRVRAREWFDPFAESTGSPDAEEPLPDADAALLQ